MILTNPSPRIPARRLLLRCWTPEDAPLLKAAIDASLDHLRTWMSWAMNEPSSLATVTARLAAYQADFLGGGDWRYGIFERETLRLVGGIGLHRCPDPGALEIGYWLRADSLGHGWATEAAARLTDEALTRCGAARVIIRCDPNNVRSAAIPRRLGFLHATTHAADQTTPAGQPRDTMVWEMTADARMRARPTVPG